MLRLVSASLLIAGFILSGALATDTELLFFWPACLLIGLGGLIAALSWKMKIFSSPSDFCFLSMVLFTAYMAARATWSPVAVLARPDLMMIAAAFVAYVLVATTLSHPGWRMALLISIVVLVVGNLIVSSVHVSGRTSFHVVPHFVRTFGEGRVGGFFNNANHLAAFLNAALMMMGACIFFGRSSITYKLLMAFVATAASVCLVLTKSRAGLAAMGIGLSVLIIASIWVLWRTNRHLLRMLMTGGIIIGALLLATLYQLGAEAIKSRTNSSPLEQDVRGSIWKSALWQHQLSPWVGKGSRMFTEYGVALREPAAPNHQLDPIFVHNEYLQVLADYGWIGLILLALLILLHLTNGLRFVNWFVKWRYTETGELQSNSLALAIGALAASIALLAHATFEFHFHTGFIAVLGGILAGILMNPGFSLSSHSPPKIPGLRVTGKLMLATCGIGLVVATLRWAPSDYWGTQANLASQRDDIDGEIALLSKAISNDPHNPEWRYQRGLARLKGGLSPRSDKGLAVLTEAEADLRRSVELNTWHYLYPVAHTDVLDALGRTDEAQVSARIAIRAAPWHEEPRIALAMHYARSGRFADAERAFLWARRASGANQNNEMNWEGYYQQMLRIAATVSKQS
ncbi:MAG: O-antigen ligase family protein [Verrucomicrobiaceae bacterium]|nr:O-antigen ligase family protein [Verrucomicrobiaceae bacterium]